eukprot:6209026-Pleurochrysis_carterae.AAC.1
MSRSIGSFPTFFHYEHGRRPMSDPLQGTAPAACNASPHTAFFLGNYTAKGQAILRKLARMKLQEMLDDAAYPVARRWPWRCGRARAASSRSVHLNTTLRLFSVAASLTPIKLFFPTS